MKKQIKYLFVQHHITITDKLYLFVYFFSVYYSYQLYFIQNKNKLFHNNHGIPDKTIIILPIVSISYNTD